jgi:ABC-2 type transport system ATP-binding protein
MGAMLRDTEKAIEIKGLSKFYGTFQALKEISFEVKRGDFFAFLGPNGAGKTTTINTLTGLSNYQTGSVKIFGFDVTREYRQSRRIVGLCAQEFNFDPFLNIQQLLVYQGGYFGVPKKEAGQRAVQMLERFKLLHKRKEEYRTLSGGMKRRLLICRALMHDPQLLILDEPTAGADLELKYQIWDYLKELNKEGRTIMLTTHYMEEAERLCGKIAIIHQGNIVRMGDKAEVLKDRSLEHVFLEATSYEK